MRKSKSKSKSGNNMNMIRVLVVAVLVVCGGEMKAAHAVALALKLQGFRWPAFLFCLPGCLLGEKCFLRAFKACMDPKQEQVLRGKSWEFCLQAAQYYCDIGHMPWKAGTKIKSSIAFRKTVAQQYDPSNHY